MALISCPNCGQKVSDQAIACPYCGTPIAQGQNTVIQPVYNVPNPPKDNKKTIIIAGVAVIAVVVIVITVLITLLVNNNSQSNASPNTPTAGNTVSPSATTYEVTIKVECEYNSVMNQYDVDILIDDQNLATQEHGANKSYKLKLSEGTHEIEFRINGQKIFSEKPIYDPDDETTFREMYIHVSENDEFSYYVKMDLGNSIKVTQK